MSDAADGRGAQKSDNRPLVEETALMAISPILTRSEPAEQRLRVLTHNVFGRQAGWEDRRRVLW